MVEAKEESDKGNSFEALVSEMSACTVCSGLPLGPRPIFKVSPKAKILIAGQAPGRKTHEKGIPFDDPSGDRLRDWLGVDRQTFYDHERLAILPMGFCYPGTGSGGDLPPRPECAQTWREKALDQMGEVDFTIIIGRYAIDWHLPDLAGKSVTEAVKHSETMWPHSLVLPHPSPRNNRWLKQNPWFETDILPRLKERVSSLLAN